MEACQPLPKRNASDKLAVIMRDIGRKHKTTLLRQGRKLKGINVFINKHLTKHNVNIARAACYLRKIQNTWTSNCKVVIKLNRTPKETKMLVVGNITVLDKYQ